MSFDLLDKYFDTVGMSTSRRLDLLMKAIEKSNAKDKVMACLVKENSFQSLMSEISDLQYLRKHHAEQLMACLTEDNVTSVPPWVLAQLISTEQSNDLVEQALKKNVSEHAAVFHHHCPNMPNRLLSKMITSIPIGPNVEALGDSHIFEFMLHVNPTSNDTLRIFQQYDVFHLSKYIPSCPFLTEDQEEVTQPIFEILSTQYVCVRTEKVKTEYVQLTIKTNRYFAPTAICNGDPIHLFVHDLRMRPGDVDLDSRFWTVGNPKLARLFYNVCSAYNFTSDGTTKLYTYTDDKYTSRGNLSFCEPTQTACGTWNEIMLFCRQICLQRCPSKCYQDGIHLTPLFSCMIHGPDLDLHHFEKTTWHELLCILFTASPTCKDLSVTSISNKKSIHSIGFSGGY